MTQLLANLHNITDFVGEFWKNLKHYGLSNVYKWGYIQPRFHVNNCLGGSFVSRQWLCFLLPVSYWYNDPVQFRNSYIYSTPWLWYESQFSVFLSCSSERVYGSFWNQAIFLPITEGTDYIATRDRYFCGLHVNSMTQGLWKVNIWAVPLVTTNTPTDKRVVQGLVEESNSRI